MASRDFSEAKASQLQRLPPFQRREGSAPKIQILKFKLMQRRRGGTSEVRVKIRIQKLGGGG